MRFSSLIDFALSVRRETLRVVWPTRSELIQSTLMVLVMVAVFALFFLAVDTVVSIFVRWVLGS